MALTMTEGAVNLPDFFTVLACGIGGALAGHFIVNIFTDDIQMINSPDGL